MEELEDPTESLKETLEAAEEKKERWTLYVALSTAIIAVMAAMGSMYGNHHANEAMLEQVKSSDQWAYYQSKSIKAELAASTAQIFLAIGKPLPADNVAKMEQYKTDKEDIKKKAEELESNSEQHMKVHVELSRAVTIFQVAIAISAISILTRKKLMWYVSMVLAVIGCVFLTIGFLMHSQAI
jgi:heme/copper-type cytochrome/quinol oxidase subunit 4